MSCTRSQNRNQCGLVLSTLRIQVTTSLPAMHWPYVLFCLTMFSSSCPFVISLHSTLFPVLCFLLRAVVVPLLCSTFLTIFQLMSQSPYHVPDTSPSTLEMLIHSCSPQQAYEASPGFILILQMRDPSFLVYPKTQSQQEKEPAFKAEQSGFMACSQSFCCSCLLYACRRGNIDAGMCLDRNSLDHIVPYSFHPT